RDRLAQPAARTGDDRHPPGQPPALGHAPNLSPSRVDPARVAGAVVGVQRPEACGSRPRSVQRVTSVRAAAAVHAAGQGAHTMRKGLTTAVAFACGLTLAGGIATAATSSSPTVKACRATKGGALGLVTKG